MVFHDPILHNSDRTSQTTDEKGKWEELSEKEIGTTDEREITLDE